MAYEPLNLQNGQTLTAEDLQHMEQGILTVLPIVFVKGIIGSATEQMVEYAKTFQPFMLQKLYDGISAGSINDYQAINPFSNSYNESALVSKYVIAKEDECGDARYSLTFLNQADESITSYRITNEQYVAIATVWENMGWIEFIMDGDGGDGCE